VNNERKDKTKMKINRFYLAVWIINFMLINWLFLVFVIHPETMKNIYYCMGVLTFGIIGFIINTFNAFEKEKEEKSKQC
jgi:hypothetical protein